MWVVEIWARTHPLCSPSSFTKHWTCAVPREHSIDFVVCISRNKHSHLAYCMNIECAHFHVILVHTSFMQETTTRFHFSPSFHSIVPKKFTRLFCAISGAASAEEETGQWRTRARKANEGDVIGEDKNGNCRNRWRCNVKLVLTMNSWMSECAKQIWRY